MPWRAASASRSCRPNCRETSTCKVLLGLDDTVSPGYERIHIKLNVKADSSDQALDDLLSYAQRHSPVCNTVCRPVPVVIERGKH